VGLGCGGEGRGGVLWPTARVLESGNGGVGLGGVGLGWWGGVRGRGGVGPSTRVHVGRINGVGRGAAGVA